MHSLYEIKKSAKKRFISAYNRYSPIYTDYINIILRFHSKGLNNSAVILHNALTGSGYKARLVKNKSNIMPLKSRVNIFLETINPNLLKFAKYNLLISNPEWDYHEIQFIIDNIDCVIAKTKDSERIFKRFFYNVEYTSFSSKDIYDKCKPRRTYVHFAGKSTHKGTEAVINLWNRKKDLPRLYLYSFLNDYTHHIMTDNIIYNYKNITDDEMKQFQLRHLFHICPSEYEGFGHQINEAKSAASIVFTTDAPPMNELITNEFGYLIKATIKEKLRKAVLFKINEDDLYYKIMESKELSEYEIEQKRIKSRESYLFNDSFFKQRLIEVIEQYF